MMSPRPGHVRRLARPVFVGLAVASLALPLGAHLRAQQARLDVSNPDDAVRAMRKIQSSLVDGKPTVFWFQGSIFSRVPGEADRLLFSYQAMNVRATKTVVEPGRGYGYRMVSREVLLYQDPKTKEVLRTWKNPWTGKECDVVHVANDPVNSPPTFALGPRGPATFPGFFKDGIGFWTLEIPLWYTNPLGGEYQAYVGGQDQSIELFNFFFREDQVLDASPDAPDVTIGWARVSGWLPWMEMGSRAGQLVVNGSGRRLASWDRLPEVLKTEIDARYPGFKTPPPLDDARPNETSWTVFKKFIDKKKADAAK